MARPGGIIQAFCEPVTTTSMSQASIWKGMAPMPLTPSTRMSVSGAASRMAPASCAMGLVTPVEVSLKVTSTALGLRPSPAMARIASRTESGSAAWPHSTSRSVTSAP